MPAQRLIEGLDYYIENGRWVFTEHFLRARGYCCGNGCRHCPYELDGTGEEKREPAPGEEVKKGFSR